MGGRPVSQSRSPTRPVEGRHSPARSAADTLANQRVKFVDLRSREERKEGDSRRSALRAALPAPHGEAVKEKPVKAPEGVPTEDLTSPRAVSIEEAEARPNGRKGKSKGKGPWKGRKGKGKPWSKGTPKGSEK